MTVFVTKALLLVPVFFLGLTAGAFLGNVYYGRRRRRRLDQSLLQPTAVAGAVLAVIAVAIYWQLTGR